MYRFGLFIAIACIALNAHAQRISPFTEVVHLESGIVNVRFQGRIYELVSINDTETSAILLSCQTNYGRLWQKRFDEDLPEVLERMGLDVGTSIKLELRDPASAEIVRVAKAQMTEANRRAVYKARQRRPRAEDEGQGDRKRNDDLSREAMSKNPRRF